MLAGIQSLAASSGTKLTPTVGLTASTTTPTVNTSVTFAATVSDGSTTTPSGTVTFAVDGTTAGSPVTLSGGAASYTLSAGFSTTGSHTLTVTYSGDTNNSAASNTLTITVSTTTTTSSGGFSMTSSPATLSVTAGTTSTEAIAITSNGFAGPLTFRAALTSSSTSTFPYCLSITTVTLARQRNPDRNAHGQYGGELRNNGQSPRKRHGKRHGTVRVHTPIPCSARSHCGRAGRALWWSNGTVRPATPQAYRVAVCSCGCSTRPWHLGLRQWQQRGNVLQHQHRYRNHQHYQFTQRHLWTADLRVQLHQSNHLRKHHLHPCSPVARPIAPRRHPISWSAAMHDGTPSRTAYRVALRRAAHQVFDQLVVFADPLALQILGLANADRRTLERSELRAPARPGSVSLRAFLVARSRFAEDALHAAPRPRRAAVRSARCWSGYLRVSQSRMRTCMSLKSITPPRRHGSWIC